MLRSRPATALTRQTAGCTCSRSRPSMTKPFVSAFATASAGPSSSSTPHPPRARRFNDTVELPRVQSRFPVYAGFAIVFVSSWVAFVMYAMNAEKAASSVVRTLSFNLKTSPDVRAALGDDVRPVNSIFGEPWISGNIGLLSGSVDIHFRVQGSRDGGTAYFTSIRRTQSSPFEILTWKIIKDSGEVIQLIQQ
ncbi:uncharacterized protein L969DRAFT_97426 [Mixia osmundae IAM 14324]|uniref:DUF1783-domain-containing protein n=1 Tax=Mixia osmundae (strain CBS 9802 / IAM 14324 / JCM 22182 / KY 12970) TaxID=764103 RepID=G7DUJ0_MIXOS|nr:uncharacterized protein L969DRAFT_97426 [Mixia osmundae IAM 14324]KEI36415.1 hypothetical protein L969DRAFT_97426 [Mixia osmundae IAM 14324]GAA94250.1 hypothetical protein E5Q_00899 [Mixia osmundae IAM 14324]